MFLAAREDWDVLADRGDWAVLGSGGWANGCLDRETGCPGLRGDWIVLGATAEEDWDVPATAEGRLGCTGSGGGKMDVGCAEGDLKCPWLRGDWMSGPG